STPPSQLAGDAFPHRRNVNAVQTLSADRVSGVSRTDGRIEPGMRRVVLVSNRVLDLRRAPQAGGVAVALADVVRLHNGLWFGWNGEITSEASAEVVSREGRLATVPLSETDHQGYYLGYANSVLWPVFHNRLDLAQFEAGFFDRFVAVNRRLAASLEPL